MDWDKLRVFHAVAEAGSLTHAGEALHLSQSAVSRQIRGLEQSIGAPLFHRHPRGLILTGEGEHLFFATQAISREVTAASARIRDSREELIGELRITTTVGFGSIWLAPRLARFLESAPNLNIDFILGEAVLDLPMREADIAIRMREPMQADVIRRRLMDVATRLYATPAYIKRFGAPATIDDLRDHRLIIYSPKAPQPISDTDWLLRALQDQRGLMTVNNDFGVMQAALNGLGVAAMPDYLAKEHGGFVQVAPEIVSPSFTMYLVYAEELRGSRRVAQFREFILREINTFMANEPPPLPESLLRHR
jgi:DNA-binding transcriptional LysR family regulator